MTVNLCRGHADVADLVGVIDQYRPDLVAVQELGRAQASVLGPLYGFGVLRPDDGGEGHGLVSSLPMTVDRLVLPGRSGLQGEIRAKWGRLSVIAVHLLNPLDAWLGRAPFRGRQVAALCDLLDADPTERILLGDLNATRAFPAYRQLTRRLDDAVARWAHQQAIPPSCTWSQGAGSRRRLRIDHVMVSGLEARQAKVVAVKGSDHRALIVDLVPVSAVVATGRDRAA